ncbi:MAG: polyprenol monophosphomannose synthase [Gemmataceae bacterium]
MPPTAAAPRILVTLATYNERENITPLIKEIQQAIPSADVLVIDDNSPDGTGKVADELAAGNPSIHVLHRPGKQGLGTATLAAMRYAMDHDYDFMVNMDADFSHHPRYLPAILAGMKKNDIMIGSRYIKGGGSENWPLARRIMSWGVGTTVRLLMRIPARDTSGAFRCYRVSKLRQVDLKNLWSKGYSFQQEVLYRCRKAGARIGETPIIFENRRAGTSKVNPREALRSMAVIFLVGFLAFFGFDKARPAPQRTGA